MLDDFVSALLGLLVLSKEKAEEFIELLVEKGEMRRDDAQKMVNRMIDKGKAEKGRFTEQWEQFKEKLEDLVQQKNASREELTRVESKIDELAELIKEKLR
ncbi:MAG: hypothetical protein GYA86_07125 [Firmicutes bacterium]|jgi:polyhydroxyalkanoate synthesis regulator phasin|nr:hypothetical protein [Bacillota bacterium]